MKPKSFIFKTQFVKVSFLLIANYRKKSYILSNERRFLNMDRTELAKTIEILKTQPKENKGFSFRRTIKTLKQAKQNKPINDYYDHLIKAKAGVDKDE